MIHNRQDSLIGLCFLGIAISSFLRLRKYFGQVHHRDQKVTICFNTLIFVAGFSRALWFLIPNEKFELTYTPTAIVAYRDKGWVGLCISELFLQVGSLTLYGVFILITCYWIYMLDKLDSASGSSAPSRNIMGSRGARRGSESSPFTLFSIIMGCVAVAQLASVALFIGGEFNSEEMIVYDSVLLSIVAVVVLMRMTSLSSKIKLVLESLQAIQHTNSQPQIRRIVAIVWIANFFFVTRVILECTLSIAFITMMREHHSFSVVLSDYYWLAYINIKHFCEVAVLGLSLVISTAIKSYDASIPSLRRQGMSGSGSGSGSGGGSSSMTVQMGRYGSVGTKEGTHAYAPVAASEDVV